PMQRTAGKAMAVSCPSASVAQDNTVVIGVVVAQGSNPRVAQLPKPVPLESVAHLIPDSVPATEVLLLPAPSPERPCVHFNNGRCALASRIVQRLPVVAERLSPCAVRPSCRWWRQEGAAACRRCPQIVTEPFSTMYPCHLSFHKVAASSPERGGFGPV